MNVIEPPLDRTFIHDSYACRRGKGVHAAVDRYQAWARRYAYALKMDVARILPVHRPRDSEGEAAPRIKDRPGARPARPDHRHRRRPSMSRRVYFPGDDLLPRWSAAAASPSAT